MKIVVLVKAVPMETDVSMTEDLNIDREKTQLNLNIADEAAVEAALVLTKGRTGAAPCGTVTVLSMGTLSVKELLRDLIGRGVDEALLLSDRAFAGADTYATACTLSSVIPEDTDLLFTGRRAMDGETGQVPAEIASRLGWHLVTNITSIELTGEEAYPLRAHRTTDDGEETVLVPKKSVLSFCEYALRLRLPSIFGRRRAMKAEIPVLDAATPGIPTDCIGLKGSLTRVRRTTPLTQGKRKGPRVTDPEAAGEEIAKLIRGDHAGPAETNRERQTGGPNE